RDRQPEQGSRRRTDIARIISPANEIAGVRPSAPEQKTAGVTRSAAPQAATAQPVPAAAAATAPAKAPEKKTVEPPMDPALHDIYSRETAGHLGTIREYIAACALSAPPYVVRTAL